MEERVKVSSMDMKAHVNNLRKNPKFTEEILGLVEADLEYGLTISETEEYTAKRFDLEQMKVYSACLRKGYPEEVKVCIGSEGLNGEQMRIALEYYEKGVPLETISEVLNNSSQTAYEMQKLFQNILERLQEADEEAEKHGDYAKELLEQIKLVVEKIAFQESRYDALSEVLLELRKEKAEEAVQHNLQEQLTEKDTMLEKQQDELNEARAAIARYRNELEGIRREKEQLESYLKDMEKREADAVNRKTTEKQKEPVGVELNMDYKVAVMDANGKVVSFVPVEQIKKKKDNSLLTALFSRIAFKRKIDIVKLVIENNLEPKQLVQVRSAIEQGLSDEQLLVLINNQIPAEQMEEIIQIAVYENKQREE